MAQLIDLAVRHVRENNLKGRTPIYSAARFVRLVGDVAPEFITTDHLNQYRQACAGLSPKTIESSIGNILTVISEMTGRKIPPGKRLKLKKPVPRPVPDDAVNAVYELAPQWLKGWIALTVWTGLRVGDGVELMWEIAGTDPGSVLRTNAGKTGKQHVFPMPDWLRQIVAGSPFPREYCLENTTKYVRAQIYLCCESAGIRKWGPKNLRQRAITEWSKANATAGAILHGCGLGVMHHYLDPLAVLESAMYRVRLPACFGVVVNSEDSLLSAYRRLDPSAQGLISMTAERLAAG
jgi:integrase